MAWLAGEGKRQHRKEASAHKRAATERDAVSPRERPAGSRKRPANGSRRFGIEHRFKEGAGLWMRDPKRWRKWRWYETEKQRDQALASMPGRYGFYEFRASART